MIDTSRWVITEVWLGMGLRILPADRWDDTPPEPEQQLCDETHNLFWYAGGGRWLVRTSEKQACLGTQTMLHELAHWIVASREDREKINFGMTSAAYSKNSEMENSATLVEQGFNAAIRSCSHIVAMALRSR